MRILVTGGAGFIGSATVRRILSDQGHSVVNIDKLTYAANPEPPAGVSIGDRYVLEQVDICDAQAVAAVLARHDPDAVMHLAAETHVDRSIDGPGAFLHTNVLGTYVLLEAAMRHFESLPETRRQRFRFHHISTDEVFGSLGTTGRFSETTPYAPRSPYSATKAASDHLVRAWHHTYGLPVLISNCSNNYGPRQFPEKLIPLTILNVLAGEPLPVYGKGENVRDWLYVDDHAEALLTILEKGRIGEDYNVGGDSERNNLEVVHTICTLLDEMAPAARPHAEAIRFVTDRPGHDLRYAIDATKIKAELDWRPRESFDSGLRKTVRWYLDHLDWCEAIQRRGDARVRRGLRGAVA